jgi:hypothetical protein
MKTKILIALITLLSLSTFKASAQKLDLKDENQRIRQGIKSGELTGPEIASLRLERNQLRKELIRYKSDDGRIDSKERADLRRDRRKFNKNICRQKHDRQRRH